MCQARLQILGSEHQVQAHVKRNKQDIKNRSHKRQSVFEVISAMRGIRLESGKRGTGGGRLQSLKGWSERSSLHRWPWSKDLKEGLSCAAVWGKVLLLEGRACAKALGVAMYWLVFEDLQEGRCG